jgi:hypothetical protein
MAFASWPYRLFRAALLLGAETPLAHAVPASEKSEPSAAWRLIEPVFHLHDQQANRYAAMHRSASWVNYLLSALAVALAVIPLALSMPGMWLAIAEGLTLVVILSLFAAGKWGRWHKRWLQERSLAEQLRYMHVLIPWTPPECSNPWNTQRKSHPEIDRLWHQWRLSPEFAQARLVATDSARARDHAKMLAEVLRSQAAYHARLAHLEHALVHRIHLLSTGCFMGSLASVALHLCHVHSPWLPVAATVLPATASALHGLLAQGECSRVARRSRQQSARLAQHAATVAALLQAPGDELLTSLPEVSRSATRLLMAEHAQWQDLFAEHSIPLA